jgi:two-component system sensor histidine kinase GlrK
MKLSTRIGFLAALLLGLVVTVAVLGLIQVGRLATVSRQLSTSAFVAAGEALRLERERSRIEVLTRRLEVLRDPDYVVRITEIQDELASGLLRLGALELSTDEEAAFVRLRATWRSYLDTWHQVDSGLLARGQETSASIAGLLADLATLGDNLAAFAAETEGAIDALLLDVERAQRQAERVALSIGVLATLFALPVAWLTARAVRQPLGRLLRGTRTVSEGRYPVHVEVEGPEEVAELATAFNEMVDRLRELDDLKKDFLSHVSHELRTPLVAMRETNEALLDELAGPLTERQRRLLELNVRGAERLSRMVTKTLDLARMEAGAMEYEFQPEDLVSLVAGTVEAMASLPAAGERLRLALPSERVEVLGDRERLAQVVENLVSNALKYSPPEEAVVITVRREDRAVVLSVEDRGKGVDDRDKQLIFQKFHRALGRERPGFGLGLAIAREIVEAHDGELRVEDNTPRGSRFLMRLATTGGRIGARMPGVARALLGPLLVTLAALGCASTNRGDRLWELGEHRQALQAYQGAARDADDEASLLLRQGLLRAVPGTDVHDAEEARRLLGSVVQRYPGSIWAHEARLVLAGLEAHERRRVLETEIADLREELETLREQERQLRSALEIEGSISGGLVERLREVHRESGRLRAEVTRLRAEIEQLKAIDLDRPPDLP